jgi:hypothetical protein
LLFFHWLRYRDLSLAIVEPSLNEPNYKGNYRHRNPVDTMLLKVRNRIVRVIMRKVVEFGDDIDENETATQREGKLPTKLS